MPKKGRQFFKRGTRKLYLGEWLARTRKRPADLAKAIGVTPGYVSDLISAKKDNPGPVLLLEISEFFELTVNDLYKPPPPLNAVEAADNLTAPQMAVLARLLDGMKPKPRR